jgi:membrane protein YdbS with pleckstrin-like domain
MMNNELVGFIKTELAEGQSKQEVVNSLTGNGWKSADIEEAFKSIVNSPASIQAEPQHTAETVTEKKYPITKLWIFKAPIIAVVVSIIVIFFRIWFPYLIVAIPVWLIANPLIRSRFHYSTGEKFFDVQHGVFSKKQRHLPYGVIQNVVVKQDWFDRVFGLATLVIEDASQGGKSFWGGSKSFKMSGAQRRQGDSLGSSGNQINITGMKKDDAESLKLIILQRMKENPVAESGL